MRNLLITILYATTIVSCQTQENEKKYLTVSNVADTVEVSLFYPTEINIESIINDSQHNQIILNTLGNVNASFLPRVHSIVLSELEYSSHLDIIVKDKLYRLPIKNKNRYDTANLYVNADLRKFENKDLVNNPSAVSKVEIDNIESNIYFSVTDIESFECDSNTVFHAMTDDIIAVKLKEKRGGLGRITFKDDSGNKKETTLIYNKLSLGGPLESVEPF